MKHLKKLFFAFIATLLAVVSLASCGETKDTEMEALEAAAKKVNLTQDKQDNVTDNFDVTAIVKGDDGVTYEVTWTSNNSVVTFSEKSGNFYTAKVDYLHNNTSATSVTLTAKISKSGSEKFVEKTFTFSVPKFTVNTIAEYDAAQAGTVVTVKGVIVAREEYSANYKNTSVYLQDVSGNGGYYAYRLKCESTELFNSDLKIGNTILVTGAKTLYNGLREFDGGCTYIVESTTAVTPKNTDVTSLVNAGTAIGLELQNQLISFNGLTVVSVGEVDDKGRWNIVCGDENDTNKQITIRVNTYITPSSGTIYNGYVGLNITKGAVINASGVCGWYNGAQLHPVDANSLVVVSAGEVITDPIDTNVTGLVTAANALDANVTSSQVYNVSGIVCEIVNAYTEANGVTFKISDETKTILVNGVTGTFAKYVSVGDEISFVGNVKKTVSGDTTTLSFEATEYKSVKNFVTVAEALEITTALADNAYADGVYVISGTYEKVEKVASLVNGESKITLFNYPTLTNGQEVCLVGSLQKYVKDDVTTLEFVKTQAYALAWNNYFDAVSGKTLNDEFVGTVLTVGFKDNSDATKTQCYAMVITADGPVYVFAKGFTKEAWSAKFVVNNAVKLLEGEKSYYNGLHEYVVTDLSKVEALNEGAQTLKPVDITNKVSSYELDDEVFAKLQGAYVSVTGKAVVDGSKYYIQVGEAKIQIFSDTSFYDAKLSENLVADKDYTVEGFLGWYKKGQIIPFADGYAEEFVVSNVAATISFEDKANRTTFNNDQQVWEQNSVKVTNDKSESTTNCGDYANPVRFYQNSKLTIEYTSNITKIVITTKDKNFSNTQAVTGATIEVIGTTTTITLDTPATSFVIESLANQVRIVSIDIYTE